MLNIALFGPPGAGKGTQSVELIKKYNLGYIATGDMLREEIAEGSALGHKAKDIIEKGGLAPDEIIVQIIEKKIETNHDLNGFLFDGFPRTFVQAYILEGLLLKMHTSLTSLLSIEVPRDESVKRLLSRGETSGRSDDNAEVINYRLQEYEEKTLPVLEFYKDRGKFVAIDGMQTIDETFDQLTHSIDGSLRQDLLNIVMLGYPGSGRGTQAKMLAEKYDLDYISTGDLLFEEVKSGSDMGHQVKEYIERGDIVPDEYVIRLIERHIKENPTSRGFIFKGFPRTIVQAYILDGILRKMGSSVSCIIDVEVRTLQLIKRLVARGEKSNRVTYKTNTESIIERLEEHEETTLPVVAYYEKDRKVKRVDGNQSKEEVFNELCAVAEAAFRDVR